MRYDHKKGVKRYRNKFWLVLPVVLLIGGLYMLLNVFSPQVYFATQAPDTTAKKLTTEQPNLREDRLYVPKINVDVAIVDIKGDEKAALEKGAIHRSPSSGNPRSGGNYVVAAHRFNLGYTPAQTHAKSPFYHIDRLSAGDAIYVDFAGTRYAYKVSERKTVAPSAVEIEKKTDDDQLTLYSCELSGPTSGREVVIAKPIGKVVWTNGQPRVQPLPAKN